MNISRPATDEYNPYYEHYIYLVESQSVLQTLEQQGQEFTDLFTEISEEESLFAYEKGKWTIKELLGHTIDTEQIMAYRALCIYRGEKSEMTGFDQDDYVHQGNFNDVPFSKLVKRYQTVRAASLSLFDTFDLEKLSQKGKASGSIVSVRALMYIIAGHEVHHVNILKERYLPLLTEKQSF